MEIALCIGARMSGIISDVFMTFKSFSDVLTFLSDEVRFDSKINTGVYLKKNIFYCSNGKLECSC